MKTVFLLQIVPNYKDVIRKGEHSSRRSQIFETPLNFISIVLCISDVHRPLVDIKVGGGSMRLVVLINNTF